MQDQQKRDVVNKLLKLVKCQLTDPDLMNILEENYRNSK